MLVAIRSDACVNHRMFSDCFSVYDFNMDGYISRDEMYSLFKKAMVKQTVDDDPDESIKDLSDLALKKMVGRPLSP